MVPRDLTNDAARVVYADWLEERGEGAAAAALRAPRFTIRPRFRLRISPNREPIVAPTRRSFEFPEPPFRLLVIGDFQGKVDNRPIEDRTQREIDRDNFSREMTDQRPGVTIDMNGQSVRVPFRRTSEMEAANTQYVLARLTELAPEQRAEAERQLLFSSAFHKLEQRWHGLRALVHAAPAGAHVDFLNASIEDLAADLDDAGDLKRWGFYRSVPGMNHPAMKPYTAFVFADSFSYAAHPRLLKALADFGRHKNTVMLLPEPTEPRELSSPEIAGLLREPAAGYVAICASQVIAPKGRPASDPRGPLEVPANFAVAARLLESWEGANSGVSIDGVTETFNSSAPTSIQDWASARSAGANRLLTNESSLCLLDSVVAGPSGRPNSLAARLLLTRIAHVAADIHLHISFAELATLTDPAIMAAHIAERLAQRLARVHVELSHPVWLEAPTGGDGGLLEVDMTVTSEALERPLVDRVILNFRN
ncbi:MAG: type VI secretion system contractile sheath small subunit [Polyangiaceae bacterium]